MTSSPGLRRRSPSFGDVRVVSATRFADEPELTKSASRQAEVVGEAGLELLGEAAGGQVEVEARVDEAAELLRAEDAAGVMDEVGPRVERTI